MPIIIFAIKTCFFNKGNNNSIGQKPHTSRFFSFFYDKMIRIICTILAITIKDPKLRLNNKNSPLRKKAVLFEPYT